MFGTWFYHKRVRTAVSVFGSLFNNIYVLRQDSSGRTMSQVKVPLSYAPKDNFLERLTEMSRGEEGERRVAIKLPRMSFEISNIQYDAIRQLPKLNTITRSISTDNTKKKKIYTSVPYNLTFELNVYAKTQDDALQIVEQILPYFSPQYTVSIKPFSDYPDILEDVPIVLNNVTFQDNYEGALEQRRSIIYTLSFEMKISFHGPEQEAAIIRKVNNNLFNQNAGLADSDIFITALQVTPNPTSVSPDSDYGFNITRLDSAQ
jgi:hypothetical protein